MGRMNHPTFYLLILYFVIMVGVILWHIYARQKHPLTTGNARFNPFAQWRPVLWLYLISLVGMGLFWTQYLPPVLAQEVLPSPTASLPSNLTSTPLPTAQPTPTRPPTETPLPIPDTGLIWNPNGQGVYLWQTPGQNILTWLANGVIIRFLDEWEPYGGKAWARVDWDGQAGWVNATIVWRVTMPETFPVVLEGTYLFAAPAGNLLIWLSPGTPVRPGVGWVSRVTPIVQEIVGKNGQQWMRVTLLDGMEGWVQKVRLAER